MFGEHIEAMIVVFQENDLELDPESIAEAVLDIIFAQGLCTSQECDTALVQLTNDVKYALGVPA